MPKITEMFAFVVADTGPDDEGILGVMTAAGWMPLVGGDLSRVESLRPHADEASAATGKPYRILRFALVGEIE